MINKLITYTTLSLALGSYASAAMIIGTDFTGITVAGATASNINWGIDDAGVIAGSTSMTADNSVKQGSGNGDLYDTADSTGFFAVKNNIGYSAGNQGSWSTSFTFTTSNQQINIESFTLKSHIFSGAGDYNTTAGVSTWTVALSGGTGAQSVEIVNPQSAENNGVFTAATLDASTEYTVKISVTGTGSAGFNAGIDSMSLNGTVTPVPEPSSTLLLGLGGLALILRKRR